VVTLQRADSTSEVVSLQQISQLASTYPCIGISDELKSLVPRCRSRVVGTNIPKWKDEDLQIFVSRKMLTYHTSQLYDRVNIYWKVKIRCVAS